MGIQFKYECKCGLTKDAEGHCDGSHEKLNKDEETERTD
jgi:CDGSH-type Zn-finger protein